MHAGLDRGPWRRLMALSAARAGASAPAAAPGPLPALRDPLFAATRGGCRRYTGNLDEDLLPPPRPSGAGVCDRPERDRRGGDRMWPAGRPKRLAMSASL